MAAIVETEVRVTEVQIEGLALLKIVKHCHESLPHMVTGSLLGLVVQNGILEISHAFPFPDHKADAAAAKHNLTANTANANDDNSADDDAAGLEGHEFQLEMMRMLRQVNVDNNCVGWYQSMYLGIYSTSSLLENQLNYQTDLSPNAVVILYDPMQTSHGNLVLKCYRLTDECIEHRERGGNSFINPKNIFEEVPVKISNPGLVRALLADIASGMHVEHDTSSSTNRAGKTDGLYPAGADVTFDRLDLSTNPYLEKHLEFLCTWVDDLSAEQQKFQYYARQLNRANRPDWKKRRGGEDEVPVDTSEGWASSDAPRRMESLLINNQIRAYCEQMDKFTAGGLGKLYVAGGLHKNPGGSAASSASAAAPASN